MEETKRSLFLEYAEKVKNLGYKVFVTDNENTAYGWIVNEKNEIGYFQLDDFGIGVRFSTKHKPTHEFGCGFGLDGQFSGKTEMTREVVDRVFMHHPDWAIGNLRKIEKYTADEFLREQKEKWHQNIIQL